MQKKECYIQYGITTISHAYFALHKNLHKVRNF